jgi:hypothetical protein
MTDYLVSSTGHLTDPPVQNRFRLRALAHVRPDECKWAVLEDPKQIGTHLFCCLPTDGNSPYCDAHHQMAQPKPTKRLPHHRMALSRNS